MRKYLIPRFFTCILLLTLMSLTGPASSAEIDMNLSDIFEATPSNQPVSVLIFLEDRVDLDRMASQLDRPDVTFHMRHTTVMSALREKAASTQGNLIGYLNGLRASGDIEDFQTFWLVNAIEAKLTARQVDIIARRPDVAKIYYNYGIELIEPVDMTTGGDATAAVENGVSVVRAPEAWALGYTGAGILVSNIDTGVEGDHPALASRWAGVADSRYAGHPEWAWHDPYLGINDFPYDGGGHGTHTMGTICGGAPGDEIGVAPGALWIASASIDRGGGIDRTVADAILSFQWIANPDGDPGTSWDVPHVCSNSWGVTTSHGYPPCDTLFWSYIDACEVAGSVVLFAAGNEGTGGLRRPGDRATDEYRNTAVAACDGHTAGWPLASFSSIGPTYCTPTGDPAIKPDIAGPGVSVRSAYPGQTYTTMSGTSMATPHVAGVVALVREANLNLSVDDVKQIIFETAYDLGTPGEDIYYGYGMVDAYEAVLLAEGDTTRPRGDFVGNPTSGCTPLTVVFTDLSTGEITSWDWDFGDGGSSTEQNPTYTYNTAGSYTVILTVTGPGGFDTETKAGYIKVYDPPVADFSAIPTTGNSPLNVSFTDLSAGSPTSWNWDFGDGVGTSTEQNPSYTYITPGTYTVTLSVSNACASDDEIKVDYINVTTPSYAVPPYSTGFELGYLDEYWSAIPHDEGRIQVTTANGPHSGSYHLTMDDYLDGGLYSLNEAWLHTNLGGLSDVELTFWWTEYADEDHIEDGVFFSDDGGVNFTKVYDLVLGGAYQQIVLDVDALAASNGLSLTSTFIIKFQQYDNYGIATDGFGFDDISLTSTAAPPLADFSGTPTSGDAPLLVNFTDLSSGSPTSWSWDFGDGGTSTVQNPSYTYDTAGVYTVSLTVTNAYGSDNETKVDFITVTEPVIYKMHVADIVVGRVQTAASKVKWQGTADVTIVTAQGDPLPNATVTGVFNNHPGSQSATTGPDGVAYLTSKTSPNPPADWCFEVTNVTHATYTYDPGANVVTYACESGYVTYARLIAGRSLPDRFILEQNHPNPFNPITSICFALPYSTHVE
ncbi:MAG: PKD domain-containing protein, partial [Candidatus Thorarchaeota archaeon]